MVARRMVVLLFLLLVPALCWSGITLRPGAQLEAYAAKGQLEKAEALASAHEFDSQTLGRALWRALMRAPVGKMGERIDIVQVLLASGADANWSDRAGITPLMLAAQSHHVNTVSALLQAGAMPDTKDKRGRSAADHARGITGDASRVLAILGAPPETIAQPEVQNLDMAMAGSDITVTYDLVAPQPACVKLIGSIDGGTSYTMKLEHVVGDLGEDIPPGTGKKIVWRSGEDYPDGLEKYDALIDVVASYCN